MPKGVQPVPPRWWRRLHSRNSGSRLRADYRPPIRPLCARHQSYPIMSLIVTFHRDRQLPPRQTALRAAFEGALRHSARYPVIRLPRDYGSPGPVSIEAANLSVGQSRRTGKGRNSVVRLQIVECFCQPLFYPAPPVLTSLH